MAGFGTTQINFGTFSGSPEASVAITGQGGILSASQIGAWIRASGTTSDHTSDEHRVENIKLTAQDIVAGTGFTVYGECLLGGLLYGAYNVDWAWS
jgi:hypothetical protein